MHYMLAFFETPAEIAKANDPAEAPAYWGAWNAYIGALQAAGVMVSGNGLQPPATATIVTTRDGRRHIQDGPFPDSKEQLGGYVIVDLADLDTAIDWAGRSPCAAAGHTEVRPVLPPPSQS